MTFLDSPAEKQKNAIRNFYDRLSPHFRELWGPHLHDGFYQTGKETREKAQEQLVEFLASIAGIPSGSRVLDVGCGMGATSVWLAQNLSCEPTGITLSPRQIEMAQELAASAGVNASFLLMDAENMVFDKTFDALWMVGVLGHLPSQQGFVRIAGTLIRPGGRFLLADWTVGNNVTQADRETLVRPVIEGMMMPTIATAEEYRLWLEESGFRVLKSVDITEETRKTWDQSIRIVQAPAVLKLASSLGKDALALLAAISAMKKAMKKGVVRYSVVVAEKT
jgi:tocopherol O-methyltransferase